MSPIPTLALSQRIQPGATPAELLRNFCIIAHITIGALRQVGIPARYVSGYLHPRPDAQIGETIRGESHAWVEWWVGSWTAFDPTNRTYVGDRHVVLARGREYNDVPPLRGIYAGTAAENLEVKVQITREA